MTDRIDASGLAGGLIAAALMDTLVSKGVLTNTEARDILKRALDALGPDIKTPEGGAAGQAITSLMTGRYTERR
jgi:hypothetical protein